MTYRLACLALGGLAFEETVSFVSDSSSEEEYPFAAAGGMPDSARCNRSIPMQEPTSLTTSSWGALLTSHPLTASRQSPACNPALSAELLGTTQLRMQGAWPDIVNPKPCCPLVSLATLYAGEACRCEVTGGEKGLARAFFCRLEACIVKNRAQKKHSGSLHSVTTHIVQPSFDLSLSPQSTSWWLHRKPRRNRLFTMRDRRRTSRTSESVWWRWFGHLLSNGGKKTQRKEKFFFLVTVLFGLEFLWIAWGFKFQLLTRHLPVGLVTFSFCLHRWQHTKYSLFWFLLRRKWDCNTSILPTSPP